MKAYVGHGYQLWWKQPIRAFQALAKRAKRQKGKITQGKGEEDRRKVQRTLGQQTEIVSTKSLYRKPQEGGATHREREGLLQVRGSRPHSAKRQKEVVCWIKGG